MKSRYSIFALARNAMNYHKDWERAWRSPEPKAEYDVVIVGAGGHGLAKIGIVPALGAVALESVETKSVLHCICSDAGQLSKSSNKCEPRAPNKGNRVIDYGSKHRKARSNGILERRGARKTRHPIAAFGEFASVTDCTADFAFHILSKGPKSMERRHPGLERTFKISMNQR